jgi:hypothetical protein
LYDAKSLERKFSKKLSFEGTAVVLCGKEIWVGDKAGKIHIFDH